MREKRGEEEGDARRRERRRAVAGGLWNRTSGRGHVTPER